MASCRLIQKRKVTSSTIRTLDAVNRALSKTTNLNEETKIVTDSLTASVRTLEPTVGGPTVIAQSMRKSDSVIHLSAETFSFIKHGDTDIFQSQVR